MFRRGRQVYLGICGGGKRFYFIQNWLLSVVESLPFVASALVFYGWLDVLLVCLLL